MRSFLVVLAAGVLAAVEPIPFIEMPTAAGLIGPENFEADLEISDWPVSEAFATTVTGKLSRVNGRCFLSDLRLPSIAKPSAQVQSLQWNANGIVAVLSIEQKTATVTLQVDSEQTPSWPNDRWSAEHPSVGPQRQGSVRAAIGSATMPSLKTPMGCRARLMRPLAPGRFDMGVWKDGLCGTFDLGTSPGAWNRTAMTRYVLPAMRDLRAFDGFRLKVSTQSKTPVELGVWIQEASGSWWYSTRAVYATCAPSTSEVLFADFSEAFDVGPSGPRDADGRLDLSQVQAVGLGLIDPIGRGSVEWNLKSWELIPVMNPRTSSQARLVQVQVQPRFREVNGQTQIPAEIFGGGDPELPPAWDPGCNRFVGDGVHIPRQMWASLRPEDLPEAAAIWKSVAEVARVDTMWSAFAALLSPAHVNKAKELAKDQASAAQALAEDLNIAIRRSDLADWSQNTQGQRIDTLEARRAVVQAVKAGRQPRISDLMIANRASLQAMLKTKMPGFRSPEPTETFLIESPFARTRMPLQISRPLTWKDDLHTTLDTILAACALEDYNPTIEAWDAPGQGWMERMASRQLLFDQSKRQEQGPVYLAKTGAVLEHLVWHQDSVLGWIVHDPTRISSWPGRSDAVLHDAFALEMGTYIKTKNPKARFLQGWGLPLHADAWRVWEGLYRPGLDHCISVLDGITEQHGKIDPISLGGSYELLNAYGRIRHGKNMKCYNTGVGETRQERELYATDGGARYRCMQDALREIVYLLQTCPDKVASRIQLGVDASKEEMRLAYEFLLKRQRGPMIKVTTDDPKIWAVSSINTRSERVQGLFQTVQVHSTVLFNNHQEARPITFDLAAIHGTQILSARRLWTAYDPQKGTVVGLDQDLKFQGTTGKTKFVMEPRSAVVIWAVLDGASSKTVPVVREEQRFAPELLREVLPNKPLATAIVLEPDLVKSAASARLRVVVEHLAPAEGQVEIAGQVFSLPGERCAENENRTLELPLKMPLTQQLPLVFRVKDGPFAGYRVIAASVVVESQR